MKSENGRMRMSRDVAEQQLKGKLDLVNSLTTQLERERDNSRSITSKIQDYELEVNKLKSTISSYEIKTKQREESLEADLAKKEKEKEELEHQVLDEKSVTKTFKDKAASLETQLSQCVVMKDSFFKELSDCRSSSPSSTSTTISSSTTTTPSTASTSTTSSGTTTTTTTLDDIAIGEEYIKETVVNLQGEEEIRYVKLETKEDGTIRKIIKPSEEFRKYRTVPIETLQEKKE